jgi:hypothetical protein
MTITSFVSDRMLDVAVASYEAQKASGSDGSRECMRAAIACAIQACVLSELTIPAEVIDRIAHRFATVHPRELDELGYAMGSATDFRETFFAGEITKLLTETMAQATTRIAFLEATAAEAAVTRTEYEKAISVVEPPMPDGAWTGSLSEAIEAVQGERDALMERVAELERLGSRWAETRQADRSTMTEAEIDLMAALPGRGGKA